jgi:hypothetical protein
MPRSARPRKSYRPRELRVAPIIRYSPADETRLQLLPHVDLERFRSGTADAEAWSTLATRVNWGAVLAARHAPDAVPGLQDAARALASIIGRHAAIGRWGVSGLQFTTLAAALNAVDDMQKQLTRRELHDALQVVMRTQNRPDKVGELMEVLTA